MAERRVVSDGPLPYLLSVPSDANESLLPILVFLHGYDEGAPTPLEAALTRHGPLGRLTPGHVLEQFLIAAPQLPTRGDFWRHFAAETAAIVADIRRTQPADDTRAYLTGFSFGANGVFDLALLQPELWAALWPVDPTRVPLRDPGRPIWLTVGQAARYRWRAFVEKLSLQSICDADGRRIYTDEGDDHVGAATRAYADSRIYAWLQLQQRV